MGGNKKITALMLYAAVVALRTLASVALSSTTALHRIQQNAVASKRQIYELRFTHNLWDGTKICVAAKMRFAIIPDEYQLSSWEIHVLGRSTIIHKWKEPKEVILYVSDLLIGMGKELVPRVLLLAGGILFAVFFFLSRILPEGILPDPKRAFIMTLLVPGLMCLIYFLYPILIRFFTPTYQISDKTIVRRSIFSETAMSWKTVTGYSLFEEEQFPDVLAITVHAKKRKMVLLVPKGELSEQVTATFSQRCTLISERADSPPARTMLTNAQYLWLLVFSLAYSMGIAYLVHPYRSGFLIGFVVVATMVFGPGTLGCIAIYGIKSFRQKDVRGYALIFNFLAAMFLALFLVLLEIYYWSKIIKELE